MSYPTSPPWAPPPAPPAPPPAPEAPYTMHGQLLVPYPEEMYNAGRPKPPAVWPVAVFTLVFGAWGAISAARRAARARRARQSVAPYWITFAGALVAGGFLSFVVGIAVAVPAYEQIREAAITKTVQHNVVSDGTLKQAGMNVTGATCTTVDLRGTDGLRDYACLVKLADGSTSSIDIVGDENGAWESRK